MLKIGSNITIYNPTITTAKIPNKIGCNFFKFLSNDVRKVSSISSLNNFNSLSIKPLFFPWLTNF